MLTLLDPSSPWVTLPDLTDILKPETFKRDLSASAKHQVQLPLLPLPGPLLSLPPSSNRFPLPALPATLTLSPRSSPSWPHSSSRLSPPPSPPRRSQLFASLLLQLQLHLLALLLLQFVPLSKLPHLFKVSLVLPARTTSASRLPTSTSTTIFRNKHPHAMHFKHFWAFW